MTKNIKTALFLTFILSFVFGKSFSQQAISESQKLSSLCHIWGMLKYHHPSVTNGKLDWDQELIKYFDSIEDYTDSSNLNRFFIEMIKSLGTTQSNQKSEKKSEQIDYRNFSNQWVLETNYFSDSLKTMLILLGQTTHIKDQYYVTQLASGTTSYKNENPYPEMKYPSYEYRLLGLFRYWNIVNYFYPYKYLIDEDWETVLMEMIPRFQNAKDTNEYNLAIRELVVKINDSHGYFNSPYVLKYFGKFFPPVKVRIIDNTAVITEILDSKFAKKDDLRIGDAIYKLEAISIENIINNYSPYFYGSNKSAVLRNMAQIILNGNFDSVLISYTRGTDSLSKIIHRYMYYQFNIPYEPQVKAWKFIDTTIGYVNLGELRRMEVKHMISELADTKAIVFDLRQNANGTWPQISKFINSDRTAFAKFTFPILSRPGLFKWSDFYYCGKKNKNAYTGQVIVLINEFTQSHGEFTCMALKASGKAIFIGSNTSGADGNTSTITFPGGYTTAISGVGVYYPDESETQRVGIAPDVWIYPTANGIQQNKDEVLERALMYIKYGF